MIQVWGCDECLFWPIFTIVLLVLLSLEVRFCVLLAGFNVFSGFHFIGAKKWANWSNFGCFYTSLDFGDIMDRSILKRIDQAWRGSTDPKADRSVKGIYEVARIRGRRSIDPTWIDRSQSRIFSKSHINSDFWPRRHSINGDQFLSGQRDLDMNFTVTLPFFIFIFRSVNFLHCFSQI